MEPNLECRPCPVPPAAADPLAEVTRQRDEAVAALRAAEGFLFNAKIDLETGCPKRVAIGTIEGGIKRVRRALVIAGGQP